MFVAYSTGACLADVNRVRSIAFFKTNGCYS